MEQNSAPDTALSKGLIEAILFIETEAVPVNKISEQIGLDNRTTWQLIKELQADYETRKAGIQINEYAIGIKMSTNREYADILKKYYTKKNQKKFSHASLETLAIIAYKQSITRAEIEDIRGVSCDNSIRDLMEKNLIKITGRRKVPGNPMEYGTTKEFLAYFGLKSLKEMPTLKEIKELNFD